MKLAGLMLATMAAVLPQKSKSVRTSSFDEIAPQVVAGEAAGEPQSRW